MFLGVATLKYPEDLSEYDCCYLIIYLSFLQVNRSPSFGTDSKLDYDIKSGLLRDAIKLLNIRYDITIVLICQVSAASMGVQHPLPLVCDSRLISAAPPAIADYLPPYLL